MSRTLTKKQRGFVNDFADTGNATLAAKNNYNIVPGDDNTARAIGSENLTKLSIKQELEKLGFDSNNAKRVVGEILNKNTAEDKDRLKAAETIFKVHGDFAPDKSISVNYDADTATIKEIIAKLRDPR